MLINYVKNVTKQYGFLLSVLVTFIILIIIKCSAIETSINDEVLIVTFFAIFWNALETFELKKLQKEIILIELQPVLKLHIRNKDAYKYLTIQNIGRGVAMNIIFEKIPRSFTILTIEQNQLAPNEEIKLFCKNFRELDGQFSTKSHSDLISDMQISKEKITIKCNDVNENTFIHNFLFKDDEFLNVPLIISSIIK